jgi:hypothetical protein
MFMGSELWQSVFVVRSYLELILEAAAAWALNFPITSIGVPKPGLLQCRNGPRVLEWNSNRINKYLYLNNY